MREGWEYKKLGQVCTSDLGKTLNKSKDRGELHPYLCSINILWDKIDLSTLKQACFEAGEQEKYTVRKGDLLVCEGGDTGRSAIWDRDETILYQNALHRLRFHESVSPKFVLFYLLYLKDIGEIDNKYSKGVTIKHLVKKALLSIPLPLPPKPTQLSIVSELDKLNELIRIKKEQLKDYDALAQSIFYEMFGDPVVNEKGWEVKRLGDVCSIERGGSPRPISAYITESNEGLNWIKIGDATDGSMYIYSTKEKIKKEGLKKTRYVHEGDLLLSNSMSFGHPYILKTSGCIHDGWLVIRDKKGVFNTIYLYYTLSSKSMYYQFESMAVGGVVNNLNSKMVSKVYVTIPPLSPQQSFAQKIEQIEQQKAAIQKTITDLETLLAARMQYWFD